jgi:hypothetical protein
VPQGFAEVLLQHFEFHGRSIARFIANRYWYRFGNIYKERSCQLSARINGGG